MTDTNFVLNDGNVIDFSAFARNVNLPPSNIEAEEYILGGLIAGIDADAICRIQPLLKPESFFIESHKTLYRCILDLYEQKTPVDLMTVLNWLSGNNLLDKIGGREKLAYLVGLAVSMHNADAMAALIREKYIRRLILQGATKQTQISEDGTLSVEEMFDSIEQVVYNITRSDRTDKEQVESVAEILPALFQMIENGSQLGIPSGFLDLDAITGGFFPGTLTIVAGRTGMSKTQMAIALSYELATKGHSVVFFSCEMSKVEIANRILARSTMIDSYKLRQGNLASSELELVAQHLAVVGNLPIYVHSSSRPTPFEMRSVVRQIARKHNGKLGLVVLDYIQLLGEGSNNRVNEVDAIVRDFRAIGKEFNVATLGLAQINRGVESRQDKRPLLSDIRESGAVENHADVVLLLYRDQYYNPLTPDKDIIEINVAKNRHGSVGIVRMIFKPEHSLFLNLARQK